MILDKTWSWAGVVSIATGYGLVGARAPMWLRIFSSPNRSDRLWGPPNFLSNGYRVLFFRGVKRQGREAVVTICKWSVNPITNPSPVCSH
jgi:hypothetical protein